MSCSEAINSSSGGVADVLSDCGKAMARVIPPAASGLTAQKRRREVEVIGLGQIFDRKVAVPRISPLGFESKMAGSSSQPACKNLVLDAGPLLSFSPLRNLAQTYYIAPQVISELKDPRAKQHFESLALNAGIRIQVRDPSPSSIAHS